MLISKKFINKYLKYSLNNNLLKEKLISAGFEVENIKDIGKSINNILTGKILKIEKHKHSKKMLVCTVDIKKEVLKIITTDNNVHVGMIVPVATNKSKLFNKNIDTKKINGVFSYGVFCSAENLGIPSDVLNDNEKNRVFSLPKNTKIGEDIKKILDLDDIIFDINLTANRSDCYSMYNLVKEISILYSKKIEKIKILNNKNIDSNFNINITNKNICNRYVSKIIKNVKINDSPLWFKNILRNLGVRPINNVVDITNYVMIELGQPMHAFDLDKIEGNELNIKYACENESFITLDGINRKLKKEDIIISDKIKTIAIAGIMGGKNSQVTYQTKNIILESASFNSFNISKTSKNLNLKSEASIRFEKRFTSENTKKAIDRASYLIKLLGVAEIDDLYIDKYFVKQINPEITISFEKINSFLGLKLSNKKIIDIFNKLNFKNKVYKNKIKVIPYNERIDIKREVDLLEEVARMYGYEKIPINFSKKTFNSIETLYFVKKIDKIKRLMSNHGFNEVINYSFIDIDYVGKIDLELEKNCKNIIIKNPINEKQSLMRSTLFPGILENIVFNYNRQQKKINFFEIGRVYYKKNNEKIKEFTKLAFVVLSPKEKNLHGKEKYNFFNLKGLFKKIMNDINIDFDLKSIENNTNYHPSKSAAIIIDNEKKGYLGEIHFKINNYYNIIEPIYYCELNLNFIKEEKTKKFKKISKYPKIERDLSILVPTDVTSGEIEKIMKEKIKTYKIYEYKLFDLYSGKQINKKYKSMGFKIFYQDLNKTLTDAEVNKYHFNLFKELEKKLKVVLR